MNVWYLPTRQNFKSNEDLFIFVCFDCVNHLLSLKTEYVWCDSKYFICNLGPCIPLFYAAESKVGLSQDKTDVLMYLITPSLLTEACGHLFTLYRSPGSFNQSSNTYRSVFNLW